MRIWIAAVLVAVLGVLAGCPPAKPPVAEIPLPPPLPLGEQVRLLNNKAAAVPTLRARGHVTIEYTDSRGTHTDSADGTLLLRQRPADAAGPSPADLLLAGRYLGNDVFELGLNRENYWLINRAADPKYGYRGAVAKLEPARRDAMPIHPDRVLALLALTPLVETPTQRLAMLVSDHPGVNVVLLVRTPPDGPAWVDREVIVDRRTGRVEQVRLLDPRGVLLATARLSDYRPITFKSNDPKASTGLTGYVPFHVLITAPQQKARMELELSDASLTLGANPALAFEMPDFAEERIKAVDVDVP